ncbi:MAG: DHHA1 domain-containing protein, partial [Candidatus Peregrinibacteria bacterium]|nr:DHHA1 domain-containing protein [Candidatus Peregrinibacteria bacterium]
KSGMDVIVTDHHSIPKKLPESALALLHPFLPGDNYPFRELSGSAVAYKFAVALMHEIRGEEEALVWRKKLADLASLGTVADCMQLTGENRWIVKNGIDQMRETSWGGLKKLMKSAGIDEIQGYDSDVIGFCLGPRINAAGRLETPYYALQLLLDENGSATSLAEKLEELNKERRAMVECAMEQAEERLQAENQLNRKIIITWDKDWPAGIIGLIAARLNEKYNRPTIVLEDRGGELVASCRSPHYFNVAEALREVGHHLKSHGGHAAAAGFTIDYINLEAFIEEIQAHADETIEMDLLIPTLAIDYKIELEEITFDLVSALNQKAPFGTGNVKPRFLISGVEPRDLQTVGREHGHVKFYLQSEKNRLSAIAFRFGQHFSTLQNAIHTEKKLLDVVFELDKSVWNGRERLELKVVDLRFSD